MKAVALPACAQTGGAQHLRATIGGRDVPAGALDGGSLRRTSAPLQVPGHPESGRLPISRHSSTAPPRVFITALIAQGAVQADSARLPKSCHALAGGRVARP